MTTDVNQELFNTRRAMVDSGRVSRNQAGTWTYAAAADKNEVFGKDGLDTSLGYAALYSTTPAWHGLGNIIPGGTTDIQKVLELGGIDFEIELRPVRYFSPQGQLLELPGKFVTTRDDTGAGLDVVGNYYTPIQNRTAFDFLQELVNQHDVTWESAGALREGRGVFVSMRLPNTITVDAEGINDEIIPFVAAINSHDGTSAFRVVVTPWRPVCANTERFAVRDAHTKWTVRHTRSAAGRIEEARRTLRMSVNYYNEFAAEETELARTDITIAEFDRFIADLWPVAEDLPKRAETIAANRTGALRGLFATEIERVGRTAYAAERAVTDYLDHVAPARPGRTMTEDIARATRILDGGNDDVKSAAHQRLMLLRRR